MCNYSTAYITSGDLKEIFFVNIINIENCTKAYTDKVLFKDINFYLHDGEKVGIIGINGTGKSTLLKIIAGIEEPDEGTYAKANDCVIRYLPQNPVFESGHTVLESALKGNVTKENKWTIESEVKAMLTKLGITDFEQKTDELSGGQKKRLALASCLVSPADVLILDEPTNHLDTEMNDYLEDYLKKFKGALVMVTHDRYFLDAVTNSIAEIDKGSLYTYDTNYSGFLALKAEREDMAMAADRKRKSILRTELEWIQRGARARSTKQKARIDRYEQMKNTKDCAADEKSQISSVASRLGRTIVELDSLSKAYGDKVLFKDFSYIFLKNDRIGFVGKNGCGKTTLMKIIARREIPDSGTVTVGQTVKIGYYSQEIEKQKEAGIAYMDPEMRVIDYIKETAEYVKTEDGSISASQMLERFLFPSFLQYSPIGKLSGGEKRRLNLLRVLMEAPNVLILDEPTNDLDIATLNILEDFLDNYKGVVITVSHDRYFLDRTVNRIFAFEKDGVIKQYEGGYTDYINKRTVEEEEKQIVKKADTRTRERKLKFSYQEQRDFETIEGDISALEEKIENLDKEMASCTSDFVRLNELLAEKEKNEKLLEEKMDRWMYLEELAEKIKNQ